MLLKPAFIVVTVSSAGTAQQVTTDDTIKGTNISIFASTTNTGNYIYWGDSSVANDGTYPAVFKGTAVDLIQGNNNPYDSTNPAIKLSDLWVDADTSSDVAIVTYWVASSY